MIPEILKNNAIIEILTGDEEMDIPLLGVKGAGKTYFLLSLGYLVSEREWGSVAGQEGSVYLGEMVSSISRGEELPATMSNQQLEIEVDRFNIGGDEVDCDFTIYTEDFSGKEFSNAMKDVSEESYFNEGNTNDRIEKFQDLFSESDGLIVIVDLVRGRSKDEFKDNEEEYVHDALTEQVKPLANGIELAIDANSSLEGKPVFLIFTKEDVHGLSVEEISEYFDRYMAIPMRRMESKGCNIIKHTASSVGWGDGKKDDMLDNLESKGFTDILMDMEVIFNEEDER